MSTVSYASSSASRSEPVYSLGETWAKGASFIDAGSSTFAEATARLTQRVREEVAEEQQRRASARTIVLPYAAGAEALTALQERYPEFSVIPVAMDASVHVAFEAERMIATALSLHGLSVYSEEIVSLGNSVLPAAMLRLRAVHTEMNPHSAYAVHANHTQQALYHNLARNSAAIQREHGVSFDAVQYRDFLRGKIFQVCDQHRSCSEKAGAYFADLSVNALSVTQVCSGMAATGAAVGEVILPYVPEMLIHTQGALFGDSVFYEMGRDAVVFKYTEGVAGVTRFPLGSWIEWLRSNVVSVGAQGQEQQFQLELTAVRGPFLRINITKLDLAVPVGALEFRTHALDLPAGGRRYFVRSFRLRSLGCDPTKASSYETVTYMPDARVADKVFVHAMSLPKESFRDASVLKRVTVLDGRITFAGMTVTVDRPVAMEEVAQLTQDVVLRAFIARYNMGELGADLRHELDKVREFANASVAGKMAYLSCALAKCAWDWSVGSLVGALRSVVLAGLRFFRGRGDEHIPEFSPAPTFVRFETYADWLARRVYSRVPPHTGGNVLVPYLRGAVEAYRAVNRYVPSTPPEVPYVEPPRVSLAAGGLVDEIVDTRTGKEPAARSVELIKAMHELNGMAESPNSRFDLPFVETVDQGPFDFGPEDYVFDDEYIQTINQEHELAFPGMALQQWEADVNSLHYDPQHRNITAQHLKFPLVGAKPPDQVEVFKSKVNTYRVERKLQTLPQLIHALNERNMATPYIDNPGNIDNLVVETWENFLNTCCVANARELLAEWKVDRVVFEKEALAEWAAVANPKKIDAILAALAEEAKALEEMDVADFDTMVKSDAKPPLGTKPLAEQLAPQVIVYHKPALSAIYSSIFRVLTRRFLALLKPEWMVNALKNNEAVRNHFTAYYPWGREKPSFLENDFGKYDKSQAEVCAKLETYVYRELGFDEELLKKWYDGHVTSRVHSVQHALTLVIDWQRRSGGSNTSFGNVLINILTTTYVYRACDVIAGVFIGDDSLMMCATVAVDKRSVDLLAEKFNLQAKFILAKSAYFASNFLLFDEVQRQALLVPDPFKRAQRLGLSVNAKNPEWEDRLRSHVENMEPFKYRKVQALLEPAVFERYELKSHCRPVALFNALATSGEASRARACWDESPSWVRVL